jgi:dipeptidyl aminopeptidase/acylaminoacyl peptidase
MSVRAAVVVALISIVMASPAAKQAGPTGRALTIEDYYRVRTIGNQSISPSGKWVAFTVTTRREEPEPNTTRTETWIVPADASMEPRRIQHQDYDVSNPTWAEDGRLQYTVDG